MAQSKRGGRREGAGRKPKFAGVGTKVVRIPANWDLDALIRAVNDLHAIVETEEAKIAKTPNVRQGKKPSNRFEHIAECVARIKEALPPRVQTAGQQPTPDEGSEV